MGMKTFLICSLEMVLVLAGIVSAGHSKQGKVRLLRRGLTF
jgi:hypothetical protein